MKAAESCASVFFQQRFATAVLKRIVPESVHSSTIEAPWRLRTFSDTGCAGARGTVGAKTRPEPCCGTTFDPGGDMLRSSGLTPGEVPVRGAQNVMRLSTSGRLGIAAPVVSVDGARS